MKPVFQEETILKLKNMIDAVMQPDQVENDIWSTVDGIHDSLERYDDNKENQAFLYGSAALVVIFAMILMYTHKASWPLIFVVLWLGGFMYYRVHEKGLASDMQQKQSLITEKSPLPKIDYLVSNINLKIGRKEVLTGYLSVVISSVVMMAHHLFVSSSASVNVFLLFGAIIVSFFFWKNLYKNDLLQLNRIKTQLSHLKNKLVLERK